jgi:hypothetical protein
VAGFDYSQQGRRSLYPRLIICAAFLLLMVAAGSVLSCANSTSPSQPVVNSPSPSQPVVNNPSASQPVTENLTLPAHGDPALLTNVVTPPDEGREHIWPDHPVDYGTMPPASGPHFPDPTAPGFYTARPAFGYLVHSLEHGSVVIYYDPAQLTPEIEKSLRAFITANSDPEVGIVAVPDADFNYPFILTAWDKILKLGKYDPKVVTAFLAEYLGRGPENPPSR